MISPEELVRRARARCKHHRQPGVGGFCRECLLAEIEEAIAEEHPELKRGDQVTKSRNFIYSAVSSATFRSRSSAAR